MTSPELSTKWVRSAATGLGLVAVLTACGSPHSQEAPETPTQRFSYYYAQHTLSRYLSRVGCLADTRFDPDRDYGEPNATVIVKHGEMIVAPADGSRPLRLEDGRPPQPANEHTKEIFRHNRCNSDEVA